MPYTPATFLQLAREQVSLSDKTGHLKQLLREFPASPEVPQARQHLIALLSGSNRFDEALQEYRMANPSAPAMGDIRLLDYQLKTGRWNDVLRATADFPQDTTRAQRDLDILERRVQALLAQGEFLAARRETETWLKTHDGGQGSLYEPELNSIRYLARHLRTLERIDGPVGNPLFTASVPTSFNRWSRRRDVPIHFFKLIPARSGGQRPHALQPGRYELDGYFRQHVERMNEGFAYLSGSRFSLAYQAQQTLYVRDGDVDPASVGGRLLTSRVYAHTLPPLYRLAGQAFVILVDYRESARDEASYVGDGIVYISANKLHTMVLMHEILHGLGATHQDWNYLEREGYRFDPEDVGLMTFENGELPYFGLESKNRAVLDWPPVAMVKFTAEPTLANLPVLAQEPVTLASADH